MDRYIEYMLRINFKYSSQTKPHRIIILYTEVRATTLYEMNNIQQQTILFKMIECHIFCVVDKNILLFHCIVV